jgi:hypothetical protein
MQAVTLANGSADEMADTGSMSGMEAAAAGPAVAGQIPPVVELPYGFPSPGHYRIFVQMNHGTRSRRASSRRMFGDSRSPS